MRACVGACVGLTYPCVFTSERPSLSIVFAVVCGSQISNEFQFRQQTSALSNCSQIQRLPNQLLYSLVLG